MKYSLVEDTRTSPGSAFVAHRSIDGVVFNCGFAATIRRMQDLVFGPESTRIEGSPGQRFPRREMKPANEIQGKPLFQILGQRGVERMAHCYGDPFLSAFG